MYERRGTVRKKRKGKTIEGKVTKKRQGKDDVKWLGRGRKVRKKRKGKKEKER